MNKEVGFGLLSELAREYAREIDSKNAISAVIAICAMDDIPMSDAVIKLGVILDILSSDYKNNWHEEGEE